MKWRHVVMAAVGWIGFSGPVDGEVLYTVIDLGGFGGESTGATKINNAGQIVGWEWNENRQWIDLRYNVDLLWDPAGGVQNLSAVLSPGDRVRDINDSGQLIIEARFPEPDRAYLWDGTGEPEYIGTFSPSAINNAGRVVGDVWNGHPRTFVWDRTGGLRDIGPLAGGSWATPYALNNLGQVVGEGNTDVAAIGHPHAHSILDHTVQHHPFLWDETDGMTDLGTLGGDFAWARAINDSAQVVGLSYTGNEDEFHAFLWDEAGGMRDLGTLPGDEWSQAHAINSAGQVLGQSGIFGSDPMRPEQDRYFIWDALSGMEAIDDLLPADTGWSYFAAEDINDAGHIVGAGTIVTWVYDPLLEMEVPRLDTAAVLLIPEPATFALLASGLAAVIRRKRR